MAEITLANVLRSAMMTTASSDAWRRLLDRSVSSSISGCEEPYQLVVYTQKTHVMHNRNAVVIAVVIIHMRDICVDPTAYVQVLTHIFFRMHAVRRYPVGQIVLFCSQHRAIKFPLISRVL